MDWVEYVLSAGVVPKVITVLKVAFFLFTANLLRLLVRMSREDARSPGEPGRRALRVFYGFVSPLMACVLLYQASWQLTGFARPKFVAFMQRYNRRPLNPARRLVRGRILDANGEPLAVNDERDALRRRYPQGEACCHVVGYADRTFGLTGIERADDARLIGASLASRDEADSFRKNMLGRGGIRGNDVTLTLDVRLQREATRLLRGKRGAIVALRPFDGAVLVMVSAPSFDPNNLSASLMRGGGGQSALFNRAIHGLYPPGSTFKIVTAAMALESGFSESVVCPPEGFVAVRGTTPIRDHEYYAYQRQGRTWNGHGALDLGRAFALSSNVFFARLGADLTSERFNATAKRFSLRSPVVLLEGPSGSVRSKTGGMPRLEEDDRGERAQMAIGQGRLLVTPLHMALVASAVAEDGRMYRPRLRQAEPAKVLAQAMSATTAARLRGFMRQAVQSGTGRGADVRGLAVAGKTGTAQAPGGDDHAWFVCLAPVERPVLALAVVVEHGGSGSRTALPLALAIMRNAQQLGLLECRVGGGSE